MGEVQLEPFHRNVAGIDVGSVEIYVSVGQRQEVRSFSTMTCGLLAAVSWLQSESVETVAMEATGVYWMTLYALLEANGIEVYVVNGAHARNVPGRKTDVQDCQWLQQLHGYGLLRSSFVPPADIRELRTYLRLREDQIRSGASHILHMHKALELMNIKIQHVISQITGASGLRILEAILAGQRDPQELLKLCDKQIQKKKSAAVLASLEGDYKPEQLFALKQALENWRYYQYKVAECDEQIEQWLDEQVRELPPASPASLMVTKPIRHNRPEIKGLHSKLMQLTKGRNPLVLAGITDYTLLLLIGEIGLDLSKWKTAKHFVSWLGLAPKMGRSGKRSKRMRHRHCNHAGQVFRLIAQSLAASSHTALGGFYRRVKSNRNAKIANMATARKLATMYYNMLRYGAEYVERGIQEYEQQYRKQQEKRLIKQARAMGYQLVPA